MCSYQPFSHPPHPVVSSPPTTVQFHSPQPSRSVPRCVPVRNTNASGLAPAFRPGRQPQRVQLAQGKDSTMPLPLSQSRMLPFPTLKRDPRHLLATPPASGPSPMSGGLVRIRFPLSASGPLYPHKSAGEPPIKTQKRKETEMQMTAPERQIQEESPLAQRTPPRHAATHSVHDRHKPPRQALSAPHHHPTSAPPRTALAYGAAHGGQRRNRPTP
jgi:hypothetical protein